MSRFDPVGRFAVAWGLPIVGTTVILASVILPAFEAADAGRSRHLNRYALIAGLATAAAGIAGNRLAAAWDKHAERRLPAARDYFANHSLPKLVGVALAIICAGPPTTSRTAARLVGSPWHLRHGAEYRPCGTRCGQHEFWNSGIRNRTT